MLVALVVVVVILAGVSVVMWKVVDLNIVTVDTRGGKLVLNLKNDGFTTADGSKIRVKINGDQEEGWGAGDIAPGENVTAEISFGQTWALFVFEIEVYYGIWLQDSL